MSALRNLKAFLAATTPSFDPVVVVWHAKKDGGPVPLRRVDLAALVERVEELERRIREADTLGAWSDLRDDVAGRKPTFAPPAKKGKR